MSGTTLTYTVLTCNGSPIRLISDAAVRIELREPRSSFTDRTSAWSLIFLIAAIASSALRRVSDGNFRRAYFWALRFARMTVPAPLAVAIALAVSKPIDPGVVPVMRTETAQREPRD